MASSSSLSRTHSSPFALDVLFGREACKTHVKREARQTRTHGNAQSGGHLARLRISNFCCMAPRCTRLATAPRRSGPR
jgi:hypothetical protein